MFWLKKYGVLKRPLANGAVGAGILRGGRFCFCNAEHMALGRGVFVVGRQGIVDQGEGHILLQRPAQQRGALFG